MVYDFGAPFVQTSSKWSQIINISFPTEFTKDVNILDIINENNKDIETNRFTNIIKEEGITSHVADKIKDQDMVYYHKPENISSGFYTEERRIIPLKDKLAELNNLIIQLKDEVMGSQSTEIKVALEQGSKVYPLEKMVNNNIFTESYSDIQAQYNAGEKNIANYTYKIIKEATDTTKSEGLITTVFNLTLTNDTDHIIKLYSMFPGDPNNILNDSIHRKFDLNDYCRIYKSQERRGYALNTNDFMGESVQMINYEGIWLNYVTDKYTSNKYDGVKLNANSNYWKYVTNTPYSHSIYLQTHNQFMYFRMRDIYTNELYEVGGKTQLTNESYVNIPEDPNTDNISYEWNFEDIYYDVFSERNKLSSGWSLALGTMEDIPNSLVYDFIKGNMDWKIGSNNDTAEFYNFRDSQGIKFTDEISAQITGNNMWMYPNLQTSNGLLINNSDKNYLQINPKDKIIIPIVVEFYLTHESISKTMSFDIWTSLYKDPINYSFTINTKYENTVQDKLVAQQQTDYNGTESKYNIIYK